MEPVFLVANDDGYRTAGVHMLAEFAADLGDVYVVAPDREQSASSHSLTLHRPLRVEQEEPRVWSVDGTPTDCVNIAIKGDFLPRRPTFVLSGINHGGNLGDDVTYSGTVAAAIEGRLHGLPAIAFSSLARAPERDDLGPLKPWIQAIIRNVLERGLPQGTLLNVNFPDPRRRLPQGVQIARQGKRLYDAEIVEKTDPRNRKYYWIGGDLLRSQPVEGSDLEAIERGYAAITPVHLDLTDDRFLATLRTWPFDDLPAAG